ncbi:MAG TPA: uroporphyrinogen-III C-methyltransferase [Burkholderiales bacterium]|jgi:uroporphyrin-III C-methyltransferase|nr:uroporphyrinogen-III C-methyltransferase [Burkholderiales bacterium]
MGKVYLIGAGPGAADLITVRGAKLLELAGIVFHDALVQPEMLAMAPQAKKVAVGKRCSRLSTDQRFINRALVEAASKHEVVVRLKGGDPMLFGRAQEEIGALEAAGVAFEVVPGITAALAASAQLGVSLTQRGVSRSVVFATARTGEGEDDSDWAPAVANADSAALYMGVGQAARIAAILEAHGMPASTPAMIVEGASLPGSRELATTLGDLRRGLVESFAGPALLLFGEVYRERLMRATAVAPAVRKVSSL